MKTPNLIAEVTQTSLHEVEENERVSFRIQAWDNGRVLLSWLNNAKTIETVEMCIDAFFRLLISVPTWFVINGEASVYESCGSGTCDTSLICAHSPDYPEIILAVMKIEDGTTSAWISLPRGAVLTMFDEVGFKLADLPDGLGCSGKAVADGEDEEDTKTSISTPDPFAGVDMSVRH